MKRVLIAHQSTIPHYRVDFYNALQDIRSPDWSFTVVADVAELKKSPYVWDAYQSGKFRFPITNIRTVSLHVKEKTIRYQTFWKEASKYDLVIVEHAVNNLTYPLSQLHQLAGRRFAYWGHGKDVKAVQPSIAKRVSEYVKRVMASSANGYFAYTAGVKQYLIEQGLSPERIFVVNNTIDIEKQRRAFEEYLPRRTEIREQMGLSGKKALLFVGRFTPNKRIDFLLDAFARLHTNDSSYQLLLVGNLPRQLNQPGISSLGQLTDVHELAPVYVASDLFVFPGAVGLGPIQALCYDLPVVTIHSEVHGPEFEYLNAQNSVILDKEATPELYAHKLIELFSDPTTIHSLRQTVWPTVAHLTIERMASSFCEGVNILLDL